MAFNFVRSIYLQSQEAVGESYRASRNMVLLAMANKNVVRLNRALA
jgi:hypothetical protein